MLGMPVLCVNVGLIVQLLAYEYMYIVSISSKVGPQDF